MIAVLARNWWTFLIRAIAALIFGILAFAWPVPTLLALVILFGAYSLIDGIFAIVGAIWAAGAHQRWGWLAIEGLAGLGAAAVTFAYPSITALVLLYIIAFWAFVTGILEIATAIRFGREIRGEWSLWLGGIISIVFGALLVGRPAAGALAVVWLIGFYAILFGLINLMVAFALRRAVKVQPA